MTQSSPALFAFCIFTQAAESGNILFTLCRWPFLTMLANQWPPLATRINNMTYCLGIKIEEGLVFCTDSRTNAGVDQVASYSKLHRFEGFSDRKFFVLTAGNLGTTQSVIKTMRTDLETGATFNLATAMSTTEVADYVGRLSIQTQQKYGSGGGPSAGFDASASFIVGGQIMGRNPEIYMVYPEGNHISSAKKHPFLQIGEIKYGKPILERIIQPDTPASTAMLCALVSMDSTIHSNATVGTPVELLFFKNDSFLVDSDYHFFDDGDPRFANLSKAWNEQICTAFSGLPPLGDPFYQA